MFLFLSTIYLTTTKLEMQGCRRAFLRLMEQALLAMGIRATQRTILRVIPFIGMFIAGAVNYYTCKKVGEHVMKYYSRNTYDDAWNGKTIDAESEVKGE